MQAVVAYSSEPLEPIFLLQPIDDNTVGDVGGHRGPVRPDECPIHLFMDRELSILEFVGIGEQDVVSYVIRDSDGEVVLSGELNNIEHTVDISSLCAATYYIEVLYNGISYIGELTIV